MYIQSLYPSSGEFDRAFNLEYFYVVNSPYVVRKISVNVFDIGNVNFSPVQLVSSSTFHVVIFRAAIKCYY